MAGNWFALAVVYLEIPENILYEQTQGAACLFGF